MLSLEPQSGADAKELDILNKWLNKHWDNIRFYAELLKVLDMANKPAEHAIDFFLDIGKLSYKIQVAWVDPKFSAISVWFRDGDHEDRPIGDIEVDIMSGMQ